MQLCVPAILITALLEFVIVDSSQKVTLPPTVIKDVLNYMYISDILAGLQNQHRGSLIYIHVHTLFHSHFSGKTLRCRLICKPVLSSLAPHQTV